MKRDNPMVKSHLGLPGPGSYLTDPGTRSPAAPYNKSPSALILGGGSSGLVPYGGSSSPGPGSYAVDQPNKKIPIR